MRLRELSQFHENPAVIAWWRARLGRALVWLTPPARRRALLSLLALAVGTSSTVNSMWRHRDLPVPTHGLGLALVVLLQFALLWLVYLAARRFADLPAPVRRHPQLALHLSYWVLLVVVSYTQLSTGPWRSVLLGMTILFPLLIWRCGYLLMAGQHGRMAGTGVRDHLFYLWPAYGGSNTPYGKGLAYLSQFEARTTDDLARSQLAGIKLLALALLWAVVQFLFEAFLYGAGNKLTRATGWQALIAPRMFQLVALGTQAPVAQSWASIYCELFLLVLEMAVKGHMIIGMLRLFGFNVFRNTYKPLLAESIVEFWNRYFYYFKELLTTFFFLPTFTGFGKRLRKWPRLRLLAAVFSAAFVGNVYYHVIKDAPGSAMAQGLLWQVLETHWSRMFYCLLLATGIFVSMLREQGRRGLAPAAGRMPRLLRIFGVWSFFGLITIWDVQGGTAFLTRVGFFLNLFGLG